MKKVVLYCTPLTIPHRYNNPLKNCASILDQYYAERFEQEMLVWTEQTRRRSSVEIRLQHYD